MAQNEHKYKFIDHQMAGSMELLLSIYIYTVYRLKPKRTISYLALEIHHANLSGIFVELLLL